MSFQRWEKSLFCFKLILREFLENVHNRNSFLEVDVWTHFLMEEHRRHVQSRKDKNVLFGIQIKMC